jgi:hypothetical protein
VRSRKGDGFHFERYRRFAAATMIGAAATAAAWRL